MRDHDDFGLSQSKAIVIFGTINGYAFAHSNGIVALLTSVRTGDDRLARIALLRK